MLSYIIRPGIPDIYFLHSSMPVIIYAIQNSWHLVLTPNYSNTPLLPSSCSLPNRTKPPTLPPPHRLGKTIRPLSVQRSTRHIDTTSSLPNNLSNHLTTSETTMSSVAQKRLFHEYKNLSTNPPDGITAGPVTEDDMYHWEALIQGPEGTPFENGVFAAEMKFPKDYPLSPPTMKFVGGGIWHPNGTFFHLLFGNPDGERCTA